MNLANERPAQARRPVRRRDGGRADAAHLLGVQTSLSVKWPGVPACAEGTSLPGANALAGREESPLGSVSFEGRCIDRGVTRNLKRLLGSHPVTKRPPALALRGEGDACVHGGRGRENISAPPTTGPFGRPAPPPRPFGGAGDPARGLASVKGDR